MKMKKSRVIGLILLSAIFGSMFIGFSVAIDPYFPDPEDVEGYDLLYENVIEVANPLDDTAPNITAGAQIWTKEDAANNLTAVVGALIVKYSEDVFGKRIPLAIRQMLYFLTEYEDIKTYWDLLVAVVTEGAEINDISELITTTDGSIEFDLGEGTYFILSKDAEYIIFTFAFEVSDDWRDYVVTHEVDVAQVFDAGIIIAGSFLALFQTIIEAIEGWDGELPVPVPPPTPESSSTLSPNPPPTGDLTSSEDVQFVTNQIGALFGSSNFLWIILGVVGGVIVVGGLMISVRRKRK